ncbi:MAG: S8 family serine peptidase [Thermoleophilia bacterium]|nr:S8 family serine peptidase [Thermoleophilia bacterium]
MRRGFAIALVAAAGGLAAAPGGAVAADPAAGVTVEVRAALGREAAVARALGRGAVRVQRRRAGTFQVSVAPGRIAGLRRAPGVASVQAADVAFADEGPVVSQGLQRTGAASLAPQADGGSGLTIAILDLGFGNNIPRLQAAGELPGPGFLETQSFDGQDGLAGRNAYGNATNHGELVAQTVYDYAPKARYVFVNYRTQQDFLAAVDALVARRPDIVVHSNSFIEGPFDGTGPAAQAVDRAAGAGILWFNSAGNYQRRVWSGEWNDPNSDRVHSFAVPEGGVFYRGASSPITFALTWRGPDGEATDLDLALQRRTDDGGWATVATSADRQTTPGWHSETFVGYSSPVNGFFRVLIRRVAGPPPAGPMTLISREIDMRLFGGTVESSVPTPGDANGAVAVGAVDWRGDRLEDYSSIGPTDDGRMKPDVVAPTDTALAGASGPRLVGGTSNAAPNAAGAAAVLMSALRRQGLPSGAADVRARLTSEALDLGTPGPDMAFGAGRVRVDMAPPAVAVTPAGGRPVRGTVVLKATAADPSGVARLTLGVAGRTLRRVELQDAAVARLDTRRLRDGDVVLWADAADWPGNQARVARTLRIDNTPPRVAVARSVVATSVRRPKRPARRATRRPLVVISLRVRDAGGGRQRVVVRADGRTVRALWMAAGATRRVSLGRRAAGRVVVRVRATDRAGNVRNVRRVMRVR